MKRRLFCSLLIFFGAYLSLCDIFARGAIISNSSADYHNPSARIRIAVLDFGATEAGAVISAQVQRALRTANHDFDLMESEAARSAAHGVGYEGSLNLTLETARDLGAALGCDFYLLGQARVERRSSFARPLYYEGAAVVFIVSARSGALLLWDAVRREAETPVAAERALTTAVGDRIAIYQKTIERASDSEPREREREMLRDAVLIADVPSEDDPAGGDFRPPQPYRRLRPPYTEAAAEANAEATVDVLAEVGADGEVAHAAVVRWAGFGLDEETVAAVKRMHFRPAMRAGAAVSVRALLRYNFRRLPPQK